MTLADQMNADNDAVFLNQDDGFASTVQRKLLGVWTPVPIVGVFTELDSMLDGGKGKRVIRNAEFRAPEAPDLDARDVWTHAGEDWQTASFGGDGTGWSVIKLRRQELESTGKTGAPRR